ncbi:MAG: phosphoribosylanthranilate isomerase [Gammaproteobacteria bacterium]
MYTRIKICGITRVEDGLAAARLGADAIGLVFYDRSPRAVGIEKAGEIARALPPFVTVVGLFVNPPAAWVESVLDSVPIDLLQFHGDESREACERYGRPYLKAVRMREGVDLTELEHQYESAQGLLLDAYRKGTYGGTGETFDWSRIPRKRRKPIVLAGGLTPDNVEEAVCRVRPEAVDVSGGVEVSRGVKDRSLIEAFIRGVRNAKCG